MAGRRYPVYTLAKIVVPPVIRFWVRLDCQGLLNIPKQGPVIIAANHISYFDPLCLGTFIHTAGRQVRFLAKSELYRNPVLGAILRGAGQIPVYRETRDAHQALEDAVAAMREGAAVAIYPEGTTTRNPDFSPMAAKNGVARLAALTGAPVVPVGQWGAQLLFTRGKLGPFRRGIRVVERAGPPIDLGLVPESSLTEINAAKDKVMAAIAGLVAEAREGWSPPDWYTGQGGPPDMTERFQPGGVTHALVSGLVELALASALLAGSLAASESSPGAAASLAAASLLWAVLGVVSLAMAWLRARVFAAELDDEAVTLHRLGGARRYRYDQLSAVEVSGRRTRLVARDGGTRVVRGVRGAAQGNRFRARVLARARAAAGVADGAEESGSSPPADSLPAVQRERSSDG